MDMRHNDQSFEEALAVVDRGVGTSAATGAGTRSLPQIDPNELCPAYRNMRPALEAIASGISHVPVWGERAAAALTFAMQVADLACPPDDKETAPAQPG